MKNKKTKKWNRAHYFGRKKSTSRQVGHPVYVYGTSGKYRKYLTFTHTPTNEKDFERLQHNIDPEEDGKRYSYVKKNPDVSVYTNLREADRKYRIHDEDKETIKKYKK